MIDIALPAKPKIRQSFDDVLTRDEVNRLVDNVADPSPAMWGSDQRPGPALILMGCWLGPR